MATKATTLFFSAIFATMAIIAVSCFWNLASATLSAVPFNTTSTEEKKAESDWFDFKAELKKNTGGFFDSDGKYYDVKKFDIVLSNSSYLCPTNNCEIAFKQAESLSGFQIKDNYERQFEGSLKIKKDGKSKIYEVFGLYQVTGIDSDKQQLTGETYISLGEDLNLGDGINDKSYQTNGTVIWKNDRKNADLSIHGERIIE
ncbi:MAG TPA: hypothetical protein VF220_03440 [Nitrososphaeraceae archaeon]